MFKANRYAASKTMDLPVNGNQVTAITQLEAQGNRASPLEAFKSDGVILIGKGTKIRGEIVDNSILDIRPTACVNAEVRYGELSVATGAFLTGSIQSQEKTDLHNTVEEPFVEAAILNGINGHHVSLI